MTQQLIRQPQSEVSRPESGGASMVYTPRMDIVETDNELLLYGDLPGVSPEALDIRFENQELTIHGKVDRRPAGAPCLLVEYGVGDFYRAFTIGESIKAEEISAEMRDGVLTVHLPKAEAARPRRIEVKSK